MTDELKQWAEDRAYDNGYQQGRVDVLREHREQCQGKCLKCEVSAHFIDADGEEVKLPYDYSYKTDCDDNRYINAKEVLSLINRARADAIEELLKAITDNSYKIEEDYTVREFARVCIWEDDLQRIAEQLKEQKNDNH